MRLTLGRVLKLKSTVSEGLVMAQAPVATAIQAFIPDHGTMLIAYFYYQAHQVVEPNEGCYQACSQISLRWPFPSRGKRIVMLWIPVKQSAAFA